MSTRRMSAGAIAGLGVAALFTVSILARQQSGSQATGSRMAATGAMKSDGMMTKAQKIANALTAAPSTISAKATVLDFPEKEGAEPAVLRPGTNGWNCFPDMPETKGNDPMCLDEPWMKWIDAYLHHKTPDVGRVGVGYMIAAGGGWASNSDPFGMTETKDNHWGHHNPHLMILVPDLKTLNGISTDPNNGGPYVMWAGTPYAHIMAPITASGMSMSGMK